MKAATWAGLATIFAASGAAAQRTQHTQPASPPRVAAIAPAPAAPAPTARRAYYNRGEFRSDLPILLMGDGRVFADFGRGWEQARACSAAVGHAGSQIVSASGLQQPVTIQPTVTQPAAGVERLPFTPPVPAQQTPSQQLADGGRFGGANAAAQSCWARAQDGRIVVTQP